MNEYNNEKKIQTGIIIMPGDRHIRREIAKKKLYMFIDETHKNV